METPGFSLLDPPTPAVIPVLVTGIHSRGSDGNRSKAGQMNNAAMGVLACLELRHEGQEAEGSRPSWKPAFRN